MPELIAKSPLEGQVPVVLAGTRLAEGAPGPVHSIALFPGGAKSVAKALKPLGLGFPEPGRFSESEAARLVWTGRDQAFLIGAEPPAMQGAAVTDQSGGWATLTLWGPAAGDALMRLVPLDLRLAAFPVGAAARAGLGHMPAILLRTGPEEITVMVFRSMARTAWHEVEVALRTLAARGQR